MPENRSGRTKSGGDEIISHDRDALSFLSLKGCRDYVILCLITGDIFLNVTLSAFFFFRFIFASWSEGGVPNLNM